jgi:RNA polymerase sigma-70 factor (ECF subfamily)
MEDQDKKLLIAVTEKNAKALEQIYDRYSPLIFSLVNRILKDENLTIRVISEIFAIIWLKADLILASSQNYYLSLINLAKNKALDTLKRKNGIINEPYTEEYENKYIIPKIFCNDELNLDFLLSEQESINLIFTQLTEAQMYVLSLSYFKGLTVDEIAGELKLPISTINDKIKVAFSNLKNNLVMAGF